jgi:hypothetical protein
MDEDIRIEKNIPMPVVKKQNKYPFAEMEVGDSFFVKGVKEATIRAYSHVQARKLNRTYIVRAENEGVRVWRSK